jgi:hypothetical protein
MRGLFYALFLLFPVVGMAQSSNSNQQGTVVGVRVVSSCNVQSLTAGRDHYLSINTSGALCTNATASEVAGTVQVESATAATNKAEVVGNLTNNNAAPAATNVGALTAVANAAMPSYTEGRLVAGSVDLKGNERGIVCDAAGNNRCANVDANNRVGVVGPGVTYNATPSTLTDTQVGDLQITAGQNLKVVTMPDATTGGVIGSWISNNSDTEIVIKAGSGVLYSLDVTNLLAAVMYVRIYNSTNPDCTSATGIVGRYIVPASATGAGMVKQISVGAAFATGISLCVTTTTSDTNNTAIASNSAAVTYVYK